MIDEERYVVGPAGAAAEMDMMGPQPIVEVLPEPAPADRLQRAFVAPADRGLAGR